MKSRFRYYGRLIAITSLCLFAGCVWFQKVGAVVEDVVVDCAGPIIESEVGDLVDAAKDVIKQGATDWSKQLDDLISNAVWGGYCAVQVVSNELTPPTPSTMSSTAPNDAVARANTYLKSKHVHAVNVSSSAHYKAISEARRVQ